jgi:hypothetical protein
VWITLAKQNMQDRVTFYSHGFLVQGPKNDWMPKTGFIRFEDMVNVYIKVYHIYIRLRKTQDDYVISVTVPSKNARDFQLAAVTLANTIIEHWIKWIEGQEKGQIPNQLAAQLADVADAIRHLPTVEIAGQVVQEAGMAWKERTSQ